MTAQRMTTFQEPPLEGEALESKGESAATPWTCREHLRPGPGTGLAN